MPRIKLLTQSDPKAVRFMRGGAQPETMFDIPTEGNLPLAHAVTPDNYPEGADEIIMNELLAWVAANGTDEQKALVAL
jgi:hypothetical protein